jgi:hypothetical protein
MINQLDEGWLKRYNEGTLEGREDYVKLGDLFLSNGHLYKALELYETEVGEDIPVNKLIEAGENIEELNDCECSTKIYTEIVRRLSREDSELIGRTFDRLKMLKRKALHSSQLSEIQSLEEALLDKFVE